MRDETITAAEYRRLKAVEQKYKALLAAQSADSETMHSPVDNPPEPEPAPQPEMAQTGDSEPTPPVDVDRAWAEFEAEYKDKSELYTPDEDDAWKEQPAEAKPQLVSERRFGRLDAWTVLDRLTEIFKIVDADAEQYRDNAVRFWFMDGLIAGACFTANDYGINSSLKITAKDVIWTRTQQCRMLDRMHEAELICTGDPAKTLDELAEELQRRSGVPMVAVVHGLSKEQHRLHVFWMDEAAEQRRAENERDIEQTKEELNCLVRDFISKDGGQDR